MGKLGNSTILLLMFTDNLIKKIVQVVRYFETSKVTGADYGALSMFNDGPGNRKQITYGASQTTEFGMLHKLIQMYIDAKGEYTSSFEAYISRIGDPTKPTLADDRAFIVLLKSAAKDPIMWQVQDQFFRQYYFHPAEDWFEKHGFSLPLSMLVIYDSFIQSGSIMDFLRDRFPAKVPVDGGNEREWISEYVQVRDVWLETNTARPILRNTDYRTDSFIYAIRQDNWMLDKPFTVVNYPDPANQQTPQVWATIS